ncbi:MAG: alpha/beta hydrolase [Candidatus Limnocylindrales bacterium]
MRRRRRRFLAFGLAIAGLSVVGYGCASAYVYDQLSRTSAHCGGGWQETTPASFPPEHATDPSTSKLLMPAYQTVSFPSRDPGITLAAWYVPASGATPGPTVIVVHGTPSCRHDPVVLIRAGMLHRNGFGVLMVDLRDHGDSTIEDGRYSGGTKEYRDVLAAWDWLQTAQGIPASRIGLLGNSMGAGSVMDAAGEERRVVATWEDAGLSDIGLALRDELARNGYPTFLAWGGVQAGKLISGDDVEHPSPLELAPDFKGRDVYIVHGDTDERVPVKHATILYDALKAAGARVELWIVPGAKHSQAAAVAPAEYERRLVEFFGRTLGPPAA